MPRPMSIPSEAETGVLALTVNGETVATSAPSLDALLAELGYAGRKVATALNGAFVAAAARAATPLAPGDRIEIVAPRSGG